VTSIIAHLNGVDANAANAKYMKLLELYRGKALIETAVYSYSLAKCWQRHSKRILEYRAWAQREPVKISWQESSGNPGLTAYRLLMTRMQLRALKTMAHVRLGILLDWTGGERVEGEAPDAVDENQEGRNSYCSFHLLLST